VLEDEGSGAPDDGTADDDVHPADELLTVTMPTGPTPVIPVLTRDDLSPAGAERPDRNATWAYLGALLLTGSLLVIAVVHADLTSIADGGWQANGFWAAGAALVLLVLALGAVVLGAGTDRQRAARVLVLASTIGVGAAVITVGLADDRGGHFATSGPVVVSAGSAAEDVDEEPLALEDALDPEQLAGSALPITARTAVSIELTTEGRELMAAVMGCRPLDFRNKGLIGTAIGGTWTQPLLQVSPPFNDNGNSVDRCAPVIMRLPLEAGSVRPA
jgi:hypothetical protein